MTEGYDSGSNLVLVQAQVMTRDDSMGGWLPMGGWGLSKVSVRKRPPRYEHVNSEQPKTEYTIFGKRINDGASVLHCTIKKDFVYHKVMPTFHHWKTGEKRFGLTFQTAADARAFDRGVRLAVQDLLEGLTESDSVPSFEPPPLPAHPPAPPPAPAPAQASPEPGDNDVFMPLELPVDRFDSRSSHHSSVSRQTTPGTTGGDQRLHRVTYNQPPLPITSTSSGADYPYVQFATTREQPAKHEYTYPVVQDVLREKEAAKRAAAGGEGEMILLTQSMPLAKGKGSAGGRREVGVPGGGTAGRLLPQRCRHCQDPFLPSENARGQCEFAPDPLRTCIDTVTCVPAAQCMLYHCCSDAEGDFETRPCRCSGGGALQARRWLGLAVLSLLLPCLCCYPPLAGCYLCCQRCHLCGGKHQPV